MTFKRTICRMVVLGTALVVSAGSVLPAREKVSICHLDRDGLTSHVISVSENALEKHITLHGDQRMEIAAELCGDGIDNDCDGAIDEGFDNLGSACLSGIGECERAGALACSADGTGLDCDAIPGEPLPSETCGNGVDDDCNGVPDDGCTSDVTGDPATCGICCFDGAPVMALDEICANGKDDNCNGLVDENCDLACQNPVAVDDISPTGNLACNETNAVAGDGVVAGADIFKDGFGPGALGFLPGVSTRNVSGCLRADFGQVLDPGVVQIVAGHSPNACGKACGFGFCLTPIPCDQHPYSFVLLTSEDGASYEYRGTDVLMPDLDYDLRTYAVEVGVPHRFVAVCRAGWGAAADDVSVDVIRANCAGL